jgi:hypothetical protein
MLTYFCVPYKYIKAYWFSFKKLFPFALNYRCANFFHEVAMHVDIDIDIDFFFSQIIGKFYFLHVENARTFFQSWGVSCLGMGPLLLTTVLIGAPASVTQGLRS